jgi:hypothetical protein
MKISNAKPPNPKKVSGPKPEISDLACFGVSLAFGSLAFGISP